MIESLVKHFSGLEDPRCVYKVEHRLLDIVVIAVWAVIACAESFEDMALYGRSKLPWLQQFLVLPNGILSHDTFRRVFMLLEPAAFEMCFQAWTDSLTEPLPREVIAIDGKTIRGSHHREGRAPLHRAPLHRAPLHRAPLHRAPLHRAPLHRAPLHRAPLHRAPLHRAPLHRAPLHRAPLHRAPLHRAPLHLVSAWASERGLSLGQQSVETKSNEITAIPLLLDSLNLENTLVTLDAMGCQTKIAAHILARKADYLLVLKANYRHDYAAVKAHFCDGVNSYPTGNLVYDAFD